MSIREYCRSDVVTVAPTTSGAEAAARMEQEGVGCVVIQDEGRPVGLLTDRDLALAVLCDRRNPEQTSVSDFVEDEPVSVRDDAPLAEAARTLRRHAVRRLPVVDGAGQLVGLVTADDLTGLVVGELSGLSVALQAQSRPTAGGA